MKIIIDEFDNISQKELILQMFLLMMLKEFNVR